MSTQEFVVPLHISVTLGVPVLTTAAPAPTFLPAGSGGRPVVQEKATVLEDTPDLHKFSTATLTRGEFHWRTALSLALASKVAYGRKEDVKWVVQDIWNLPEPEFFDEDGTQCFVAVAPDCVIVSFRGTESFGDWFGNLNMLATTKTYGEVHRGFLGAFQVVQGKLEAHLDKHAGLPVLITGHSLGGALAAIAAAEWQGKRPVKWVHTFGQPRTGRGAFPKFLARKYGASLCRFVNDDDIVPMVPPNFGHAGKLYHFDEDGDLEASLITEAMEGVGLEEEACLEESPMLTETEFHQLRAQLLQERAQWGSSSLRMSNLESAPSPLAGAGVEGFFPSVADHSMDRYIAKISRQARV
ncbi:lipase family protein [Verrucomicrobium sp. BvORR034]|uniref:lipase family protein n=1 Tax=Verrucomicrobium sp. BvORR034 TaxID=1396418 RepID=UPI0009DF51B3|nr:lipase family protein [Verrucomicrobium sp. BvORR034]